MDLKTANGQKSATKNEDAQFTNTLRGVKGRANDRLLRTQIEMLRQLIAFRWNLHS